MVATRRFGAETSKTRAALLDVIAALGGRIKVLSVEERHGELSTTVGQDPPHPG